MFVLMQPIPFITEKSCGALTPPENGEITQTDGTLFGSIATYSCKAGYELCEKCGNKRTCGVNGWTDISPAISCQSE